MTNHCGIHVYCRHLGNRMLKAGCMLMVNHEKLVVRMPKVDRILLVHDMLILHWMPLEDCRLPIDCISRRVEPA